MILVFIEAYATQLGSEWKPIQFQTDLNSPKCRHYGMPSPQSQCDSVLVQSLPEEEAFSPNSILPVAPDHPAFTQQLRLRADTFQYTLPLRGETGTCFPNQDSWSVPRNRYTCPGSPSLCSPPRQLSAGHPFFSFPVHHRPSHLMEDVKTLNSFPADALFHALSIISRGPACSFLFC
jgi:hypothetical protein